MELKKCWRCEKSVLFLETRAHIQFGGVPPPVQLEGLCPICWVHFHPDKEVPQLPGWEYTLRVAKEAEKKRKKRK